jgi:hypothetical protein
MNLVDLKERIAIVDGFSPAERDFILDLINKRADNRWPWTCGHIAGAMCQECYRILAARAAEKMGATHGVSFAAKALPPATAQTDEAMRARQVLRGLCFDEPCKLMDPASCECVRDIESALQAAVAGEQQKIAVWMTAQGMATGHGDTTEDLLAEIRAWAVAGEREAVAIEVDEFAKKLGGDCQELVRTLAAAIRGEKP